MKWPVLLLLPFAFACSDDDTPADAAADVAMDSSACMPRSAAELPDPGSCLPAADDYAVCEDDAWVSCISDGGEYIRIQDSISSIARVGAFEAMAPLLFDPTRDASPAEFTMARDLYQEEEGLDSRVVRRFDPHFELPEATDCTLAGIPEMFPDYCVGPAQIQPIVLGALVEGGMGVEPRRNAARIEAGLLWFLYVSTFKESLTCTTAAKDCDSAYAYYTGGAEARGGLGLARYVSSVDAYAHDRAWDGIFALRCWRDLDSGDVAEMLDLRDRARAQYDRAVLDGVAAVVADRLRSVATTTGDEQAYHWAFAQVLGQAIDLGYAQRDSGAAAALAGALAPETPSPEASVLANAIDLAFDCP